MKVPAKQSISLDSRFVDLENTGFHAIFLRSYFKYIIISINLSKTVFFSFDTVIRVWGFLQRCKWPHEGVTRPIQNGACHIKGTHHLVAVIGKGNKPMNHSSAIVVMRHYELFIRKIGDSRLYYLKIMNNSLPIVSPL